jgi:hypothetical protein
LDKKMKPNNNNNMNGSLMVFLISQVNGCSYKLDANNQRALMYAPLLSDGSYETAENAYDWVEWDRLDDDVLTEAGRCHKILLGATL